MTIKTKEGMLSRIKLMYSIIKMRDGEHARLFARQLSSDDCHQRVYLFFHSGDFCCAEEHRNGKLFQAHDSLIPDPHGEDALVWHLHPLHIVFSYGKNNPPGGDEVVCVLTKKEPEVDERHYWLNQHLSFARTTGAREDIFLVLRAGHVVETPPRKTSPGEKLEIRKILEVASGKITLPEKRPGMMLKLCDLDLARVAAREISRFRNHGAASVINLGNHIREFYRDGNLERSSHYGLEWGQTEKEKKITVIQLPIAKTLQEMIDEHLYPFGVPELPDEFPPGEHPLFKTKNKSKAAKEKK